MGGRNSRRAKSVQRRPRGMLRTLMGTRRGVVGVLAMMFLIMFGSLAAAMAVVTQGNLRTAASHLRVTRAMGAVDTGMGIAASRLREAASRFLVSRGRIDAAYAQALWAGTYDDSPPVSVLAPSDGRDESPGATSLAEAIANHHAADSEGNVVADDGSNAAAAIVLPQAPDGWVVTKPIGIEKDPNGVITTAVQITYVPPDAEGRVLAVVTGYDWDFHRRRWVTRTAQQYFSIAKTVKHAILGPSRIMIGRNVEVSGPLGVRYNSAALDTLDGPPLVVRSDFYGLDNVLDEKLRRFYAAVLAHDVDGDNRLRVSHAVEGPAVAQLNSQWAASPPSGVPTGQSPFTDLTRDRIVDDFDIFLDHFDINPRDGKVVCGTNVKDGTPSENLNPEFTLDDALATLIDSGVPDRNRNGRFNGDFVDGDWDWSTFRDNNHDGAIDSSDVDEDDVVLGYRDGALDYKDQYAKIRGSVYFRATRQAWEDSHNAQHQEIGDYQQFVMGPIRPGSGNPPVAFGASDAEAPAITADSFADATEDLIELTEDADSFADQVRAQRGDNWTPTTKIESTPYGSPTPSDWYQRPIYDGLTFHNVTIPMGNNGLFVNCTFIGVTRVQCYTANTHDSWIYYGEQERNRTTGQLTLKYPPPPSHDSPAALDQSYCAVLNCNGLNPQPPAALVVPVDLDGNGTSNDTCYDTKKLSNNIRFDSCTFVGSIVADQPQVFHAVRNKLQFTGATRFTTQHPDHPDDPQYNPSEEELEHIRTSSMMLPNYSVDIGTNNSPQEQDVRLQGAIIAGVLDVRGNTSIDGVLLLTYEPTYGQAPMSTYGQAMGNPADYNITLGYFGPSDGDFEGVNLSDMHDLDGNGSLDIGWDSARDANGNLVPTAGWNGTQLDAWYDNIPDDDASIAPGAYIRRAIPFNGYGKIKLNWDPDTVLPDGLSSPISIAPIKGTYEEGRFVIE